MTDKLYQLRYRFDHGTCKVLFEGTVVETGAAACDQILELAMPLSVLKLQPGDVVNLSCHALQRGRENGRWPSEGNASFCFRGASLDEDNWIV